MLPSLVPAVPIPGATRTTSNNATPLVVLKPLTLEDKADLPEAVGQWKAGIDAMALPEDRKKRVGWAKSRHRPSLSKSITRDFAHQIHAPQ